MRSGRRGRAHVCALGWGCSALHLAAQRGMAGVVRKLLERSALNKEKDEADKAAKKAAEEEEGKVTDADPERPSDEDDWSSEEAEDEDDDLKDDHDGEDDEEDEDDDDDGGRKNRKRTKVRKTEVDAPAADADADALDDSADEPDILDLSAPDWDFGLTPLAYAIIAGAPAVSTSSSPQARTRSCPPKRPTRGPHCTRSRSRRSRATRRAARRSPHGCWPRVPPRRSRTRTCSRCSTRSCSRARRASPPPCCATTRTQRQSSASPRGP